jgi:hypothetical protein
MGIEYIIEFKILNRASLDGAIRNHELFSSFDPSLDTYNFARNHVVRGNVLPDASITINSNGLYFCDNCGNPVADILADMLILAKAQDPKASISEL